MPHESNRSGDPKRGRSRWAQVRSAGGFEAPTDRSSEARYWKADLLPSKRELFRLDDEELAAWASALEEVAALTQAEVIRRENHKSAGETRG